MLHPFLFAEDFMKYLNISNSEEMDHLLKCLSEDVIQDNDDILSAEDIEKLCAEINFEEEIPEVVQSTPLPLSDITLGDELNLTNKVNIRVQRERTCFGSSHNKWINCRLHRSLGG